MTCNACLDMVSHLYTATPQLPTLGKSDRFGKVSSAEITAECDQMYQKQPRYRDNSLHRNAYIAKCVLVVRACTFHSHFGLRLQTCR